MPRKQLYDLAFHARAVLNTAEAAGASREELLREAGVDPVILDPPTTIITYDYLGRLLEGAVARTGDEAFGLPMPRYAEHISMGVVYYNLFSIDTVGEALVVSYEVLRRFSNVFTVRVERDGGEARVAYIPTQPDAPGLQYLVQFHIANFTLNFRNMAEPGYRPRALHLRQPPPRNAAPFHELFQCPLHFGAPENVVTLDTQYLDRPNLMANPELRKTLAPLMRDLEAGLPKSDALLELVRTEVATQIAWGRVTLREVSKRLNIPARTIQHRLQQEGLTFRQVLDELRAARATTLLANPHFTLTDIALRLGFESAVAFERAFRRWTGRTPRQARGAAAS